MSAWLFTLDGWWTRRWNGRGAQQVGTRRRRGSIAAPSPPVMVVAACCQPTGAISARPLGPPHRLILTRLSKATRPNLWADRQMGEAVDSDASRGRLPGPVPKARDGMVRQTIPVSVIPESTGQVPSPSQDSRGPVLATSPSP